MTVDQHELPSPDGVSVVGRGRAPLTGGRKLIILGILGVIALVVILFSHLLGGGGGKVEKHADAPSITKGMPFSAPPEAAPAPKPLPLPIVAPAIPSMPAAMPAPKTAGGTDASLNSNIFSYTGGGGDTPAQAHRGEDPEHRGSGDADDFSASLRHSDLGGSAKAKMLPHARMTIPEGTVMPCILQTAINSQLKGFVNCVLPSEVRGATGQVILLDKGTTIFGQIRSGLRQGQDRLFILWTRARSPKNVIVALDSPAADELGRAGVPGEVNNHFWQRFGAAILFSVIGAAPTVAANALQNNNGNNSNNNYTQYLSPQQQLADTVLRSQIDIPPTLEKNQGDTVSIFVGRDLDFSDVYALSARR
jgi:type IV secretion system protein VirB10